MRFIKFILAFLFAATLLISLTYSARTQIISYGLDSYLTPYQAELTCVDFTLTSSLDIVITKACINTPLAVVELENALFSLSSSFTLAKINLDSLSITSKSSLLAIAQAKQANDSKKDLQYYLTKVAQFSLAIPVTVQKFTYIPFVPNSPEQNNYEQNSSQKAIYYGQVIADKRAFELSLKNNKQVSILSAQLTTQDKGFTAQINTDLAQLQSLLAIHQVKLPKALSTDTIIHGQFNSQLTWQNNELIENSQLEKFSVENKAGIGEIGSFNIKGTLAWQSKIKETKAFPSQLFIEIAKQSVVDFNYDVPALINYLTQQDTSAELISIIKANPSNGLSIKPNANIEIDLAKQNLKLSHIELSSKNTVSPLHLRLSNVDLSYQTDQDFTVKLNGVNFNVDTKLAIKQLESLTKEPITIISAGTISQFDDNWKITLPTDATQINLSKLRLAKKQDIESQAAIENIITHWQGNIHIDHNGLASYTLENTSQALQFKAEKIAAIEQFDLKAKITGDSKEMKITADVIADKQPISNIKVIGNINQPKYEIFADDLVLTDLLSLNLNLPVNVELIDGSLSYHLVGHLTDIDNLLNNDSTLSVSIKEMSGEVDNTWIQELNWQQKLTLTKGEISTPNTNKLNSHENYFTIAKIDTAPSLSEVSAQTSINFQENNFSLSASNITAKLLGGTININKAQWPFSANHSVDVQLTSIDLTKLLELDPKQGIIVTGNISGDLPVNYNGKTFTIIGGELHNISNGIIKVADNPTVEQLKLDDPQLKLAFDAMQNLHYHLLTSDVSMDDTGYMLFDTTIKGRNPDIDNDVNLNLNLNYDLMGLLESLNITTQIEQKLIDRLQKN